MAKNLKFNIKNAQLAQALKLKGAKSQESSSPASSANDLKVVKRKVTLIKKRDEISLPSPEVEITPTDLDVSTSGTEVSAQIESPIPSSVTKKEVKNVFSESETATSVAPKEKKILHTTEITKEKKRMPPQEYRDLKPGKKFETMKAFDSRDRLGLRESDEVVWKKKRHYRSKVVAQEQVVIRPKSIKIKLPIPLKDFAATLKVKASEVITKLFKEGIVLTINDYLTDETIVQLLGHEFACEVTIDTSKERRLQITDQTIQEEIANTPPSDLVPRPPVIAFMGHVDHGKTSLIDKIRTSNLVSEEAGAITQHIGAFSVNLPQGKITILDTPGHEAFTAMRERGANVTDIIILVIAGDDGIMPQTEEAIEKAKAAKVTIIVAINKCDKPTFNPDAIYRQLSERDLLPEAWGGSTIAIHCSAVTGQGIKELLEMILLQAEILELRANPAVRARGTVLESELHKGYGSTATLLVQNGSLRLGDALVFTHTYGRVKMMRNEYNQSVKIAPPSTSIKISGLSGLPDAGCEFIVVKSEKEARKLCEERLAGFKQRELMQGRKKNLEGLLEHSLQTAEKKSLYLIIKADTQGSLEAIRHSLQKIPSDKVDLHIVTHDVGQISESDIQLAYASKAAIIGFHVGVESYAEQFLKQTKVVIKTHDIIYHLIDDVKKLMTQQLDKIAEERETGMAIVKAIFKSSQLGVIAGCEVKEGTIKKSNRVRLFRNNEKIWEGDITSLRRAQEDVKEVTKGLECGILLSKFSAVQPDDIIRSYEIIYHEQTL